MKIKRRHSLSLIVFEHRVVSSLYQSQSGVNPSRLSEFSLSAIGETENTIQDPGKGEEKYDLRSRL